MKKKTKTFKVIPLTPNERDALISKEFEMKKKSNRPDSIGDEYLRYLIGILDKEEASIQWAKAHPNEYIEHKFTIRGEIHTQYIKKLPYSKNLHISKRLCIATGRVLIQLERVEIEYK